MELHQEPEPVKGEVTSPAVIPTRVFVQRCRWRVVVVQDASDLDVLAVGARHHPAERFVDRDDRQRLMFRCQLSP